MRIFIFITYFFSPAMKKRFLSFNYLALVLALLLATYLVRAQEVLMVEPMDDLVSLINSYKGSRVYQLKAGEWYGLSRAIENVDFHPENSYSRMKDFILTISYSEHGYNCLSGSN